MKPNLLCWPMGVGLSDTGVVRAPLVARLVARSDSTQGVTDMKIG